jgi:hypothetical protein
MRRIFQDVHILGILLILAGLLWLASGCLGFGSVSPATPFLLREAPPEQPSIIEIDDRTWQC